MYHAVVNYYWTYEYLSVWHITYCIFLNSTYMLVIYYWEKFLIVPYETMLTNESVSCFIANDTSLILIIEYSISYQILRHWVYIRLPHYYCQNLTTMLVFGPDCVNRISVTARRTSAVSRENPSAAARANVSSSSFSARIRWRKYYWLMHRTVRTIEVHSEHDACANITWSTITSAQSAIFAFVFFWSYQFSRAKPRKSWKNGLCYLGVQKWKSYQKYYP